jgi:ABC-type transport system substrate-binding protein
MTQRRLQRLCATVLPALAAVALAAPAGAQEDGPDTASERTVRVALNGFENNLTPFTITFATGRPDDLVMLIYDSLLWSQTTEDPEAWLAESATPSDGARVWTVKLRA